MRNRIYILFAFLGILLIMFNEGCNDPDQAYKVVNENTDSSRKVNKPLDSNKIHALVSTADTINAGEMDTALLLSKGEVFIKGHLTANKPGPAYTLTAQKGQTVIATIKSLQKGGNVRINQVQQPNGAFDGPFGDSLNYTLKRNGKLRILIGENLMAGDPYTGDFMFHIRMTQ